MDLVKFFELKKALLVGIFLLMLGNSMYGQNHTYYPFKSEEHVDGRVEWPDSKEIQVWFLIPFAEEAHPESFRGVLKEIIQRISRGELKCYSSSLRCQHMPSDYADYSYFEQALRSKCIADYHPARPSVCDTSLMEYYGKAFIGYYTRNPKTKRFTFGKEVGIVGYNDPRFPFSFIFSVDLVDIKDIELEDGKNFNTWFKQMNYFHVPYKMKEMNDHVSFCDCENKEAISNLSKTLRTGDLQAIEELKANFRKCRHSNSQPLNAYKF